ncbi:hypothetical protein PUN28_015080 [Cardiocondyla obscurior]|uniref:Ribosomal protein S14 n=1 Tax=Cardiocondyla obscurior TaxID=286306 RepID=A0AAW2EYA1_9HYME
MAFLNIIPAISYNYQIYLRAGPMPSRPSPSSQPPLLHSTHSRIHGGSNLINRSLFVTRIARHFHRHSRNQSHVMRNSADKKRKKKRARKKYWQRSNHCFRYTNYFATRDTVDRCTSSIIFRIISPIGAKFQARREARILSA